MAIPISPTARPAVPHTVIPTVGSLVARSPPPAGRDSTDLCETDSRASTPLRSSQLLWRSGQTLDRCERARAVTSNHSKEDGRHTMSSRLGPFGHISVGIALFAVTLAPTLVRGEAAIREGAGMPRRILNDPSALVGVAPEQVPEGGWAPLWVDIREIELTADGHLDLDQPVPFLRVPTGDEPITWRRFFKSSSLGPWASEAQREEQLTNCRPVGPVHDIMAPPPALETAADALLGRVVDRSYGYHGMVLGTLLRIAPEKTFGFAARDRRNGYYVFVPVGDFQIGNESICKTDPAYPGPLPAVGQQVVVLAHAPRGENRDFLLGQTLVFGPDDTVIAPPTTGPTGSRALASIPRTKAQILGALEKRFGR